MSRDGLRSAQDGFSLVEVLVVLAVMALVAAIGIPSIAGVLPAQRVTAATEAVARELDLLRAEALRTGHMTAIVFDPEARRFVSSRKGAPALPVGPFSVRIVPPPMSRAGPGEIRFMPDGGSTGGRITVEGAGGRRVLAVARATGVVRRLDPAP